MKKSIDMVSHGKSKKDEAISISIATHRLESGISSSEPGFRAISMVDYGPSLQVVSSGTNDSFPFSRNARKVHPSLDNTGSTCSDVHSPVVVAAAAAAGKASSPSFSLSLWNSDHGVSRHQQQQEPSSPTTCTDNYGWDPNKVKPAPLPMFFPRDLVKLELPRTELIPVVDRIHNFLRRHSIQATFEDIPASATLQTVDLVGLRIKFWDAHDKQNFYVDVQRHCGDHLKFRGVMRQLLDAMKGMDQNDEPKVIPIVDKIKEMQALVERLTPMPSSVEVNPLEAIIHHVHKSLTSRCFSSRTAGLDCLVHFTDMRQSMLSATRQGALLVLLGQAPTALVARQQYDLDRKCREIQQVLFQLLQHGEFDTEQLDTRRLKRHRGGAEEGAMNASLHKALTIFVNSLETLSCNPNWKCEQVVHQFFNRCEESTDKDLYWTLIECIEQSHQQMAMGYLACKAMRFLIALSPSHKETFQSDLRAKDAVEKAWCAGRSCHSLLEAESNILRELILA